MRVSIIPDHFVLPDKTLLSSRVVSVDEDLTLAELAELSVKHHIAIGVYKDDTRKKVNLRSIDVLVFDFDDGTPPDKVSRILSGENYRRWNLRHILVGSKNHLRDKGDGKGVIPRYHVIIELESPIRDAEFYRFVWVKFQELVFTNLKPDQLVKDCSRYLAKHSCIISVHDSGTPLRVDMFEELYQLEKSVIKRIEQRQSMRNMVLSTGSPMEKFRKTEIYSEIESGKLDLKSDGKRFENSSRVIGTMIRCGCSLDECISYLSSVSTFGHSYNVERIRQAWYKWS